MIILRNFGVELGAELWTLDLFLKRFHEEPLAEKKHVLH